MTEQADRLTTFSIDSLLKQMGYRFQPNALTNGLIDRPKASNSMYQTVTYFMGEGSQYGQDYVDPNGQYRFKAKHSLERVTQTIEREARILDIGCGPNHIAYQAAHDINLKKRNFHVIGLDYNIPILLSKSNLTPDKSVGGSTVRLPFKDGSFAGVIMNDVLEHLTPEEGMTALIDIRRVLSPGGMFYLNIPNRNALLWRPDTYDDPGHVFLPNPEEVKIMLIYAGFSDKNLTIKTRGFGAISRTYTELTGKDITIPIDTTAFGSSILAIAQKEEIV